MQRISKYFWDYGSLKEQPTPGRMAHDCLIYSVQYGNWPMQYVLFGFFMLSPTANIAQLRTRLVDPLDFVVV
jgi:hypothetical protein